MTKSILLAVIVAFAIPTIWTICFLAWLWHFRYAPISELARQQSRAAIGMGFIAARFVQLLAVGAVVGVIIGGIMYATKWRSTK